MRWQEVSDHPNGIGLLCTNNGEHSLAQQTAIRMVFNCDGVERPLKSSESEKKKKE